MTKVAKLALNDKKYLVEIHTLKNMPTSHLNADDTGELKTSIFGGSTRARVSSQCLKNAWRQSDTFKDYAYGLSENDKTYRTRKISELVKKSIVEKHGYEGEYKDVIEKLVTKYVTELIGSEKGVVCFIAKSDIDRVVDLVDKKITDLGSEEDVVRFLEKREEIEGKKKDKLPSLYEKNEIKKFNDESETFVPAIINLFGRMSTSSVISNVQSSMSVAHALSTHAITQESDYFTAVDDVVAMDEETGSGHINETSFNSACYYEYVNFSVNQFCKNLEKNVADDEYKEKALDGIIPALLEAVCLISPETKKTSFAAATYPECVYVVIKKRNIPNSLANAFAEGVTGKKIVTDSVEHLKNEIDLIDSAYPIEKAGEFWFAPKYKDISPDEAEIVSDFETLIKRIKEVIE